MRGWIQKFFGTSPNQIYGSVVTVHVDLEPSDEAPEVRGMYVTIAVQETDPNIAAERAILHPEIVAAANPEVEDIEPLFENVFGPGEDVVRIGGRIFHGDE